MLRRFAEYQDLEGAFGRRALTERAKGILMERHSTDEDAAFGMLRDQSRSANRKLIDLAGAVVDGIASSPRTRTPLQSRSGHARHGTHARSDDCAQRPGPAAAGVAVPGGCHPHRGAGLQSAAIIGPGFSRPAATTSRSRRSSA